MRVAFFLFFLLTFHLAFPNGDRFSRKAAPQSVQQARPNVPGDLILDFGVSLFNKPLDTMSQYVVKSRAVNIYYLYHIPFGEESAFSFNPGIGLGAENYNLADDVTLSTIDGQTHAVPLQDVLGSDNVIRRKSKLSVNYLDIPVELRYHSNKTNHDRGFRIAVGGRIGVLFDAHTKVKYELDDEVKKIKMKEDFSLNKLRYSLSGRLGLGAFSLFYYQNMSSLFQKDKGPEGTDTRTYVAGISLTLF